VLGRVAEDVSAIAVIGGIKYKRAPPLGRVVGVELIFTVVSLLTGSAASGDGDGADCHSTAGRRSRLPRGRIRPRRGVADEVDGQTQDQTKHDAGKNTPTAELAAAMRGSTRAGT